MQSKIKILVVFSTVIIIGISISQVILSTRNYIPKFLLPEANLQPVNGSVCFGINQKELWNFGDQADELQEHLTSNIQIRIDSKQLSHEQVTFFNTALLLFANDQNGKVVGSYGTPIRTCFQTTGLYKGSHNATIHIKDRSERNYQYQWVFNIS